MAYQNVDRWPIENWVVHAITVQDQEERNRNSDEHAESTQAASSADNFRNEVAVEQHV